MKLNLLVLLIFSVMVSIKVSAQNEEAGPQVVQAYSAIYPSVAAAARGSFGVGLGQDRPRAGPAA